MRFGLKRFTFTNILCLLGLFYISISFLSGETVFELPNNWFIVWMANIFQQIDKAGFFNVWTGYPGFNYLYFILWKPALALGEGQYYFALAFALIWGFISVGSVFLGAHFFYKITAHLWGEKRGLILGTVYILLLLTLSRWYEIVDAITIAGLLGAIHYSYKGHYKRGGIILGITAILKPIGLLILPVLLKSEFLSWKSRITIIIASLSSFVALLLPLFLGNFKIFMSSFHWQSGRPPWQSIYAFFLGLFNRPFPESSYFLDSSGVSLGNWGQAGISTSPAIMTTSMPNYNSWYNWIFLVLITTTVLAFLFLKRVQSETDLLWGILCLFGAFFAFFYGWSPQFGYWLLPFLLISFPLPVSVVFRLVVLLEYPFFYAIFLSRSAPYRVTAAPGLTVAMTAALSPIGTSGYWSMIIIRTLLIIIFGTVAWIKLPERLWNPIPDIIRFIIARPKLKQKVRRSEEINEAT